MQFLVAMLACSSAPEATPGVSIHMDFASDDFFASPFPTDARRDAAGLVDLSAWPGVADNLFMRTVHGLVNGADGFGRSTTIAFALDGDVDVSALPDVWDTVERGTPVALVDVDPDSPEQGTFVPVDVSYDPIGGPYGAPRMLSLLPLQGRPLRPHTRYAAAVLRSLGNAGGEPLGVSLSMATLAAGRPIDGLPNAVFDEYADALDRLGAFGVPRDEVAGLAVFTTGDPLASVKAVRDDMLARAPVPTGFERTEVFDDYCVFHTTIDIPTYQQGDAPFMGDGGGILFDGDAPLFVRDETSSMWVTIPRTEAPEGGWPLVVMVQTGGGGDRPLVDRGVHTVAHGEPTAPGEGPALVFAQAGYAGLSVDLPHGGLRNPTGGDAQLLMFNLGNPTAMLDNFREADAEVALHAHLLDGVTIDTSSCVGAPARSTFATDHVALFGHSMGATVAPTAAAIEPRYDALILSGAGGSWIANVMYKQSPLAVRPVAEATIGYAALGRSLTESDPALSLVQWAGEATDPAVHGARLVDRDVLMFQGVVDTYILPPIANPLSLSMRLDLAGPELTDPRIATYRTFSELAPLVGSGAVALPAAGNQGARTRALVQLREDGIEDGHEAVFQLQAPKDAYRCFLADRVAGATPRVDLGCAL